MKTISQQLGKRAVSVLLMLTMLLSLVPAMGLQAYAEDDPAPAADTYEVDGVNYYNIHTTHQNKQDIYKDMINSPNPFAPANMTLGELWLVLAMQLSYAQFDDIWFYDVRSMLCNQEGIHACIYSNIHDNVYKYDSDPWGYEYSEEGCDSRLGLHRSVGRRGSDAGREKIYDGTLRYNTSTEWVNDQSYRDGGYVKVSCTIQNVNTGNILAVYEVDFYDFEATVLLPPDEGGNYVTTTVQDSTTSNSTLSTTVKNNTANAQTASVTTSASLSSTASHTREGGKDLTFKESLNVSVEEEFSVGVESLSESTKFGVNVGFEATQLIKKSFSDTTGETKTDEKAITETITLPPHTQALMTTESSKSTITSKYNSPFAMNYTARVTIKYNTQGPTKNYSYYSHTSNGQTATYTFDATARSDLYQRAIIEGGTNYDREGINWVKAREKEKIVWKIEKHNRYTGGYVTIGGKTYERTHTEHYIDGSETVDPVILCATCLPMMDTPAQFTQRVEGTKISYSLWPTLPLASIKVLPPESITFISTGGSVYGNYNCQTADMNIGDSFRTSQLNLIGLDTDNVEFYNFSKNNGHWVIADESGEELTGDDLPVELVDEYGTVVNAVRPGTCYLKYVIDENCYAVADNRTGFIKNTDLTGGTAGIKINVKNPPVTITVENNYTNGTVDADWDYLDADDNTDTTRFFVTCVDNNDSGKLLDYEWEAKQTRRKGIEITTDEDGYSLVKFTRPGTYDVRVITKAGNGTTYKSPWYKIVAEGDATNGPILVDELFDVTEDTELLINGEYEGTSGARPDPVETVGRLEVVAFDATGKMLPVRYVWRAQESEGIELTEDGFVTFSEPGVYHVRVESPTNANYHSDWKEITAKQGFHTVSFETYGGDVIEAETVEHGKCLKKPSDPKKVNAEEPAHLYFFDGWYTTEDFTTAYDFSAPVTENMTLFAKWVEDVRTVIIFHMNDGSEEMGFVLVNEDGRCPYQLLTPTRVGYTFAGWFTAPTGGERVTDETVYTEDTELYAQWNKVVAVTLPAALVTIEEEAFEGIDAVRVEIAENVVSIGPRAFADCVNLREFFVPATVEHIDDTALQGSDFVIVYGETGSEAQRFAEANGIPFVAMNATYAVE